MMRIRLLQKYFLLAIGTLVLFLVLGFFFSEFLVHSFITPHEHEPMAFSFIARMVDRLNPDDKAAAIKEISSWQTDKDAPILYLIGASGEVLYPEGANIDLHWEKIKKPVKTYDVVVVGRDDHGPRPDFSHGPSNGPENGPPPGIGPGGPLYAPPLLILLSGTDSKYLLIMPPKRTGHDDMRFLPWIGGASLILSLLLGVGTALSLIYYSVNKNVKLADHVISEIQKGNLKARFPILRKDEFGQAMLRFNEMADEIEKLVEHLKQVETARTKLLQELAHDLRTPIASLKMLLETIDSKGDQLDKTVQKEFMDLSIKEVNYFERLLEDLLFLAQVSDPTYMNSKERVPLDDVLNEAADDSESRNTFAAKKVEIKMNFEAQNVKLDGDTHLLRRLFRNAIDNAVSFAKSSVEVSVQVTDQNKIQITVADDGPGFSDEALKSYGERKFSRSNESKLGGRLSVGLGSVVMKAICAVHRGEIRVSNRNPERTQDKGALVVIELPATI